MAGGPTGVRLLGGLVPGATLYSRIVAITMFCAALVSPVLGAWADARGRRMVALRVACLAGAIATMFLATVGPGDWVRGALISIAAYGTFAVASVFYTALLPGLVETEKLGRISGLAWGPGYLGGGLCLALNLFMLQ